MNDDAGNRLYKDGTDVYLKLQSEGHSRKLATIDGESLIMTRNSKKHFHRKMNGYGFNHLLLSTAIITKDIVLIIKDLNKAYRFPISLVLEKGKFLYFKQKGFERQIFLTIDTLENHKYNKIQTNKAIPW